MTPECKVCRAVRVRLTALLDVTTEDSLGRTRLDHVMASTEWLALPVPSVISIPGSRFAAVWWLVVPGSDARHLAKYMDETDTPYVLEDAR